MKIGLLGALRVIDADGHAVKIRSARQRALLASLALRVDQVVPLDTLVEDVWDGRPPPSAHTTLHSHVLRLRRTLGAALAQALVTRSVGYLLRGDQVEIDLHRIAALREQATKADSEGDLAGAARLLDEAMALCRGPLLADVDCAALRREHGPAAEELRTRTAEDRMDALLRLGQHHVAVGELRTLVAAHPLRERLRAQFVIALAGAGLRAEALREYQRAKQALADGLGVEPGPQLRQAHQRVRVGDVPSERPRQPAIPTELPHDVSGFVGRAAELDTVDSLLADLLLADSLLADSLLARGGQAVAVVHGMAGVGKTGFVVHWAHRNRQRFPGGQLFLDLRGVDPHQPPLAPDAALTSLLESLAVPRATMQESEDARAATLHRILTDRRLLLMLDNARDAEQVRPLLPGGPGCLVLVTSRTPLRRLAVGAQGRRIPLGPLSAAEAQSVLRTRCTVDEAELAEIAECCGRLPLTLRIVADRIAASPANQVSELIGELYASTDPMRELTVGGNTQRSVRDVLSWSYRTLSREAARLLRLLGVHFGPDFGVPLVEALLDASGAAVSRPLDELASVHLLDRRQGGRFALHDLVRSHVGEWAGDEPDGERRSAAERVLDWYLHTAVAASSRIRPDRRRIELPEPAGGAARHHFPDNDSAVDWFEREQHSLLAMIEAARQHGRHEHAWKLGWALCGYLHLGGDLRLGGDLHPRDERIHCVPVADAALDSARALADRHAEGIMLADKGTGLARSGHAEDAAECYRQALALHRITGDRAHEAMTMNGLGVTLAESGALADAAESLERAHELSTELGDDLATASSVGSLGLCNAQLGNYELALGNYRELVLLARQLDDPLMEATGHERLGELHDTLHDDERALQDRQRALALFQQEHVRRSEAHILHTIGQTLHRLGRRGEAIRSWQQAITVYSELGDPRADQVRALLESA
ncbi:MAG: AfsR/SARP family transcriptional regulator [Sciscionella sp.]